MGGRRLLTLSSRPHAGPALSLMSRTRTATPITPIVTSTPTPTTTFTHTYTTTPTSCPAGNYAIATGTATIVPGTLDIGNHCDDCITTISLPFAYSLYDQTYTQVGLCNPTGAPSLGPDSIFRKCVPVPGQTYTVYPYWGDLLTNQQPGCPAGGCGIPYLHHWHSPQPHLQYSLSGERSTLTRPPSKPTSSYDYTKGRAASMRSTALYNRATSRPSQGCRGTPRPLPSTSAGAAAARLRGSTTYTLVSTSASPPPPPPYSHLYHRVSHRRHHHPHRCRHNTPIPPAPSSTSTSTVTVTAAVTATSTATACPVQFTDVPPDHTFYPFIRCLACRAIFTGYSDGTFRPGNNVTRGQAAKIVANSAVYQVPVPPERQTFNDVSPGSTFWVYIERVTLHGAISGYECGGPGEPCPGRYFRPVNNLTRGQLAKIDSEAFGYSALSPQTGRASTMYLPAAPSGSTLRGWHCTT